MRLVSFESNFLKVTPWLIAADHALHSLLRRNYLSILFHLVLTLPLILFLGVGHLFLCIGTLYISTHRHLRLGHWATESFCIFFVTILIHRILDITLLIMYLIRL